MRKTIDDLIREVNQLEPWEADMRKDIHLREQRERHANKGIRVVRGKVLPLAGYQMPPEAAETREIVFSDLSQEQRHSIRQIAEEPDDE